MKLRHLTVTVGLACAALTLTAAGSAVASPLPQTTSVGSTSSVAEPTRDCTANAAGIRVLQVIDASASHRRLTAQDTKFICGGDDDGYFKPVGKAKQFAFAPGANASLLNGIHQKKVSLTELLGRIHTCKSDRSSVQWPSSCSNQYRIKVNKAGLITTIQQSYHP